MNKNQRAKRDSSRHNRLRIIGGRWRSRQLPFPDAPGLRPTGDRLRETLFNWLGPDLGGRRCLDAFAGSGALGFEALSRGAEEVVFLESNARVFAQLEQSRAALGADNARLLHGDTLTWLQNPCPAAPFDIVFLDPPFDSELLAATCDALYRGGWLIPGGLVYVETARRAPFAPPPDWALFREKTAGDVHCRLYTVN